MRDVSRRGVELKLDRLDRIIGELGTGASSYEIAINVAPYRIIYQLGVARLQGASKCVVHSSRVKIRRGHCGTGRRIGGRRGLQNKPSVALLFGLKCSVGAAAAAWLLGDHKFRGQLLLGCSAAEYPSSSMCTSVRNNPIIKMLQ